MRYGITPNGHEQTLELKRANRHGLIAGATGTGKTVTLQTFAERFAREGIPVFCADIKGDLEGIASGNYTVFWDVFGKHGHPVRTSVESMGASLMSRMMGLTPVQEGVVNIAFRFAGDSRLPLNTLHDFKHVLRECIANKEALSLQYGNVTAGSVGAILRSILTFENQGGASFFGTPAMDINDFIQTDGNGNGQINLLHAVKLVNSPLLYSTFLLWLLSEFYNKLPEVGDLEKPKFVFFFDEAHLLFKDGSKPLIDMVERIVRLIRSKGVGVYFITQGPADVPEVVLAQLSNRFQHALRAFTPQAQRNVTAAAKTMPKNPDIDTASAITSLRVGQALVTTLQRNGTPSMTEIVQIDLPESYLGPLHPDAVNELIEASPFFGKYEKANQQQKADWHTNGNGGSVGLSLVSWIIVICPFLPLLGLLWLLFIWLPAQM